MLATPRFSDRGFGWTFWTLVLFSIISGVAIIYMVVAHVEETSDAVAMQHARDVSRALTVFRTVYSSEVVGRLSDDATITVSHDYRARQNAIPLPATLSIELAEQLLRGDEGSEIRLVSDYPFPWRSDRKLTDIDRRVLAFLESNPTGEFRERIHQVDGAALAYARPVVMTETCVACHNVHEDSPRRDWKVGDVRGIQVVTVPLAPVTLFANSGILRIVAFLAIGFFAVISLVALLVRRNQREIGATEAARARAEENEVRIRTILDTVDAIVTVDETGIIESVNAEVERVFGYSSDTLVGRNVAILMPEYEAARHDDYIDAYTKTGHSRIIGIGREVRGRRLDGTTFPLELSISEFFIGERRLFTGILRDITARKAVEAKAREAETRLVEAIEALPDGFVLYDQNDRLVMCNTRYKEIYKKSADLILLGAKFEDMLREGARRGQYRDAEANVEGWIAERLEAHRNPDESLEQELDDGRWVQVIERRTQSGHTVGFRVDITALKEREQALQRSQDLLKATVNAALDAIIVIDHSGSIIEFNPAAETIFGHAREDVLGEEMAGLIVPEKHRSAHRGGMKSFLQTGHGPVIGQRIEIEGLRADGEEIVLELAIQQALGAEGPVFIGYARDITTDKAGQQALVEAKEKAEVASRAKAAFLAMMSHEIRTPLNGVLGILNLLRDTELDENQLKLIKTARDSGKSLLAIINDILDFSKLEAGRMALDRELFRIESVLRGVSNLIAPLADEKAIDLSIRIDPSVPEACIGDPGRLRQVLLNLASNAVKFTQSGSVVLSVRSEPSDDTTTALLTFSVKDTGIGVSEEKKDLIFSEFTTFDPAAGGQLGGTGLGLAISKSIVEAMNGEIGYSSAEGAGSMFWFSVSLPVANPSEVIDDDDDGGSCTILPRRLRILLAEDNMTNQLVVTQMLENMGCIVDVAADGREAVKAVISHRYDAVLMDIAMPGMDGIAATEAIRRMSSPHRDTPILALTAYALTDDRQRFMASGMNDVITKPVIRRDLVEALKAIADAPPSGISETVDADPFDRTALDSLLKGQQSPMRRRALDQFLADVSAQCDALNAAIASCDVGGVERTSHVLKSLGGTFGARTMADAAEQANLLALKGDTTASLAEGRALMSECERVLKAGPTLVETELDVAQ